MSASCVRWARQSSRSSGETDAWSALGGAVGGIDLEQLLRVRERERAQEHAVDDREDRRVRADAERERDDRGDGERGRRAELAKRVGEILAELAEVVFAARGGFRAAVERADVAAGVVDVAELAERLRAGGVGREAGRR